MRYLLVLARAALRVRAPAHADAVERFKSFLNDHAVGARRTSSRRSTTATASWCRSRSGSFVFQRPGTLPLGLRQARRPGDRRRRRARLDLRPRPEPGDRAQARRRALGSTPAALLAGVERRREGVRALRCRRRRTASSGWRRSRASARRASSACAWASTPTGSQAMELTDNFGQTTRAALLQARAQSRRSIPAEFRFEPPKGADVLGE